MQKSKPKPPDAPIADAVVLVDVPRVRGVEDPRLVAELRELAKRLREKEPPQ